MYEKSPKPSDSTDRLILEYNHYHKIVTENSLPEVSLTAFVLGTIFGISFLSIFIIQYKSLSIYFCFISLFHFLEYYITAKFQYDKVSLDSYVINNGLEYHAAHLIALFEFFIEVYFFPDFKTNKNSNKTFRFIRLIGFLLTILGQFLRSNAMITAGVSFSHKIATTRLKNHKLIKSGIYSYSRHPSYVGFFYWALGTQLLLLNPVTFIVFLALLYNFFGKRIKYEEMKLVSFFGDDYIDYKKSVSVGIPFL